MGDIIWGTFILVSAVFVFLLYRIFTRKAVEQRSLDKFVTILLILGGLLGLLLTSFNKRFYESHQYIFFLSLIFFLVQSFAGILTYKDVRIGLLLLVFTLLLQVPIIHAHNFSYHNQTILSLNVDNYPGKIWDIEPGSYISFIHLSNATLNKKFTLGINVIPLLVLFLYWRRRAQT